MACGNGILDLGEQCDDGNSASGDGCSSSCATEPGYGCAGEPSLCSAICGDGLVVGSEQCDDGGLNGSPASCCATDCQSEPDTDGDGTCDGKDPCTNFAQAQNFVNPFKSKVVLAKVNIETTPGNDKLKLSGVFRLPIGDSFAELNPLANGARLVLLDHTDTPKVDVTLASGAYGGTGTRGWTVNSRHTKWTFTDKTTSPASGITSWTIADRSTKAPRQLQVIITGKDGTYPVVSGDEPVNAIVVLGNQTDALSGYCGESAFVVGDCRFYRKGKTLTCKK
jgi:cysteine-rich repeat protein